MADTTDSKSVARKGVRVQIPPRAPPLNRTDRTRMAFDGTAAEETFGVVGYGHFGAFLAQSLRPHARVLVADSDTSKLPRRSRGIRAASIDGMAAASVVIVAVPFSALETTLKELREVISPTTVVMDVVSTKVLSTRLLLDVLDGHPNVIASHPLFGPPSMKRIQPGQRLVVTHEQGPEAAEFRTFLETKLGLQITNLTPEQHDRAMAYMQALPFFIARALVEIDILDLPNREVLSIPSFEKLANIAAIEEHHSGGMFDTSQRSNPFAGEARETLLAVLNRIDAQIREDEPLTDPPHAHTSSH